MAISYKIHALLLFLFLKAILYQYELYSSTPRTNLMVAEPSFTLRTPFSVHQHLRLNITYDRLIDIDFKFKILPKIACKRNHQPIFLIIIVHSDLYNFQNRKVIRETWGRTDEAIKVIFTIGVKEDAALTDHIKEESDSYKDILQGNFADSYRNLSYKHVMGLKWVAHHCKNVRYVMKADDDVIVHRNEMMKFLSRELSPWGAEGLIACSVWFGMTVDRNTSKWYVSEKDLALVVYPNYCSGSTIIYSPDVIPYLLEASQIVKYFFIDDAYVTGILAEHVNITRTNIRYLEIDSSYLRNIIKWGFMGRVDALGFHDTTTFVFGLINIRPKIMRYVYYLMPGESTG